jgi:hypothetical protein
MSVKLYASTCGTVTGEFARLMEGGEGEIRIPVPVFLVEHPRAGRYSTPDAIPIASTTLPNGSAPGWRNCFRSASDQARR